MVDIREVYKNIAASLNTICDTISKASQEDDRGGEYFLLLIAQRLLKPYKRVVKRSLKS